VSEGTSSSGKPPRRKRYRGTHPRRFGEKYKELNAERYPQAVAKVIARGQTPAGAHLPVMLREVLEALKPASGHVAIDCTLGHGGHAEEIASRIAPGGRLIGIDLDAEALEATTRRLSAKGIEIRARHSSFAGVGKALAAEGLDGVDLLFADLGVSSMQIDDPSRGFSFKQDGPLDMRMDRKRGITAAEWLASVEEEELAEAIARWGDEPGSAKIAAEIKREPASNNLRSTHDLARIVLHAKGLDPRQRRRSAFDLHPAARTFQAIRIAVNREEESLKQLLRVLPYVLRPGGRAAIITFHGGEDRLVASAFAEGLAAGHYSVALAAPLCPSRDEIRSNPRARSARLRWVERQDERLLRFKIET
jgi:16S rRNA (cytosine1402-N4)-methyltransferase